MDKSPYENIKEEDYLKKTQYLVNKHPLKDIIVDMCLNTWSSILNGKINTYLNLYIKEMNLTPQSVATLFHDVLPEYIQRENKDWRKEKSNSEKDIVCISNDYFSTEIKISSSKDNIYGNRSYAQESTKGKKSKNGYYLAINIDKLNIKNPQVRLIRLGWLDHTDWISQTTSTGQQSSLSLIAKNNKFITFYNNNG